MVVRRGRWSGLVVALALAFVAAPISAQRFAGRVLDVTDGDTVIVARGRGQVTVRLFGIDAPEGTQPFGREAAAMLRERVLGKVVDVDMKDVDVYGRLVATISIDSRDIGEELVRAGAAWHYVQYSNDPRLAAAEREARAARRGLWKAPAPQPPWTYRASTTPAPLVGQRPGTGAFHGNRESKVLHAPGCQHYNCRNCTVPFATVAQAQAAGFRVHEQCVK
jgi:endonuclease YncB( thermonuclease family)